MNSDQMRTISLLLLVTFGIDLYSQDTLKVREVFNFNIGDKFHYVEDASDYMPGGFFSKVDRITILDKYYSKNLDTVYYKRAIEGYTENLVETPPSSPYPYELKYYFHSYEDLVHYTNLDSSILSVLIEEHFHYLLNYEWQEFFESDTLVYHSEEFCNRTINGYHFSEFSYNDLVEYGEGLGITKITKAREECICHIKDLRLIYFAKGSDTCGSPDLRNNTTVSTIPGDTGIRVYPNPVTENLTIDIPNDIHAKKIVILDITGTLLYRINITTKRMIINMSDFRSGVYILDISSPRMNRSYRLIKL